MRRISWRVLALLAVLLPAAPAAAEFKPLTEAAVRALFPADKIRPAKTPKGALAFETWREPDRRLASISSSGPTSRLRSLTPDK